MMPAPIFDPNRKLLAINAFYYSDEEDRSVTVMMEADDLQPIANFIVARIAEYKARGVPALDCEQFLHYTRQPEAQTNSAMQGDGAKVMAAVSIAYLEEIGVIPTDEYNGLQYIYEPRVETSYGHIDGPMPGLEMLRDLPRSDGHFYFVLLWSDLDGNITERRIARQVSAAHIESAHDQFQEFLDQEYEEECERGTQIDKEDFIVAMIPIAGKRAIELLSEAKTEDDFKLGAPAGRFAAFLACWIVWQSPFQFEMTNPTLLTLAFHLRFRDPDFFEPIALADHGEGPKPVTLH